MADRPAPGILVEEIPDRESTLDAFPSGLAAFVGAALRGPLDEAIVVTSLAEFEGHFGACDIAHPLQREVQDFFLAGGERAAIVRVANGARPCTIRLPAGDGFLELEAVSPGRREFLRASVDYDGIGQNDEMRFNLVLQRLRKRGSERVADQEIYPGLSVTPSSEQYVTDALLGSRLARVRGEAPYVRPDLTVSTAPGYPVSWVADSEDGSDGTALTDYDLVGSSAQGTGLFALDAIGPIDFLCLPPGMDGRMPGPALLLAALRYCRKRCAMLLLEPPSTLRDAEHAIAWLRRLGIAGENALAVFPSVAGDARGQARPAGGAVAGALSRAPNDAEPVIGARFRPDIQLSPEARRHLQAAGFNVLCSRGGRIILEGDRTLASAECPVPAWHSLSGRRLALAVERILLQGTRWVVFDRRGADLASRLREQVSGWLEMLRFAGRLAGAPEEAWFVDVNELASSQGTAAITFTVGFAPHRPGDFAIYRVSQGLHGARLVPVSAERWAITQPARDTGRAAPGVVDSRPSVSGMHLEAG
jgi:uncharacterized protein